MAEVKDFLAKAEEQMEESIMYLDDALGRIRAGKANVKILDPIRIDYYGTQAAISSAASVTTPDQRTIAIQPWEKNMLPVIERAIINSEIGIMPINNGEVIRLQIPPLTEERRRDLVKKCKQECENAKMTVRNARRDAIEGLKKAVKEGMSEDVEKDGEAEVQKIHDRYIKKIDELFAVKEKEVMTV